MTKIAIPQLNDSVAPRFEAARRFRIAIAERGRIRNSTTLECGGSEGYERVRMLQIHRVDVLICNGINGAYRDMLTGSGMTVASNVSGLIAHALQRFLEGKLLPELAFEGNQMERAPVPHQDLVQTARDLFERHGYRVKPGPGQDAFLIDLVAEIACPECGRPVTVAICCGSHTYRADKEIVEFHHATPSGYHARVYVCPASRAILNCCREYGVQLVTPDLTDLEEVDPPSKIPLLRGAVVDHERALNTPGD